eukprot:7110374-Lingulodinium_polyedra.AAC.1
MGPCCAACTTSSKLMGPWTTWVTPDRQDLPCVMPVLQAVLHVARWHPRCCVAAVAQSLQ